VKAEYLSFILSGNTAAISLDKVSVRGIQKFAGINTASYKSRDFFLS
jgi:hypothetical protein